MAQRFAAVRERIAAACRTVAREPATVTLLAVSKTHPAEFVRAAHSLGQREFGENRVQELLQKARDLADLGELRWHCIGSLQTNKVKDLLRTPGLALLHSLDRANLADELQASLAVAGRQLPALLQLHATDEVTKHGCPLAEAEALLDHVQTRCPSVIPTGVMAMGPLAGDPRPVFDAVVAAVGRLRARSGLPLPILSLGMSGDLEAAVAAGSTLVRIGSALFGDRR